MKLFSAHIFTAKEGFDCLLCVNVCSTSPSFLCMCVSALFFFLPCVSLLFPGVNVLCVILCIWEWLKTPMPVAAFCINPQVYALLKIRSTSPHRFKISLSFSLECISPPFLHLSHWLPVSLLSVILPLTHSCCYRTQPVPIYSENEG